nr:MAG TPA: hypothetical protein [Caudoviricetes sp.]
MTISGKAQRWVIPRKGFDILCYMYGGIWQKGFNLLQTT